MYENRNLLYKPLSEIAGPLKRVYQLYKDDESIPVPQRTVSRARRRLQDSECLSSESSDQHILPEVEQFADGGNDIHPRLCQIYSKDDSTLAQEMDQNSAIMENDIAAMPEEVEQSEDNGHVSAERISCSPPDAEDYTVSSDEESTYDSFSDASQQSSDEPSEDDEIYHTGTKHNTEYDVSALCAMSYVLKYKLSGTASKDLLNNLLPVLCANSEESHKTVTYADMLSVSGETRSKTVHYCEVCFSLFPEEQDIFTCSTSGCSGYRYKGPLSSQVKQGRQPRNFFILADVKKQLTCMLQSKGVWQAIQTMKTRIMQKSEPEELLDIVDGHYYRSLCQPGQFLHNSNNISAIFNTDGIPLYSSSNVKLWPVFLAVNELPPASRFSRENMILAAIWQGKSKPPFSQYMCAFGEEMCELYNEGFSITPPGSSESQKVRMAVLLGTMDLQAKAYVLNMTMHNGQYGCCTCEEPGETVRQGGGYARCYPYRSSDNLPHLRESDDLKYEKGQIATPLKRQKGICGMSGLATMPWFDLVLGTVPDYMHGVLLGVTKTLLHKFFSPTNSGKAHFVGRYLPNISRRMSSICPPDYIERMPRDLEKNYCHFKATELQSWLLFYALPCLNGFLADEYMQHLSLLCEGVHLLLGDCITEDDIQRAEFLLESFYEQFADLYGEGSCGLNVHNIGAHLVFYVRLWGPLWAWSCFAFEDWNAALLQSVHGTGDVTRQCVRLQEIQLKLKSIDLDKISSGPAHSYLQKIKSRGKGWTMKTSEGASAAGHLQPVHFSEETRGVILQETNCPNELFLKKALRIKLYEQKLYSEEYTRMKKRVCHVVKCRNGDIRKIMYFLVNTVTNKMFAYSKKILVHQQSFILPNGPRHVIRVYESEELVVIPVEEIAEKLFFMVIDGVCYIACMPNMTGHSILK